MHAHLTSLRKLRNRIAHHEPILERDLRRDYDQIQWILKLLSSETAAWVDHHSRVLEVLAQPHRQITHF